MDKANFSENPKITTLERARNWLSAHLSEGARCPCCHQYTKIYQRKLYSSMAASLVALYKKADDGAWVHKRDLVKHPTLSTTFGGGDFAKLSYWELIEEKAKDDSEDKRTSGWWRITPKGIQFVTSRCLVPEYIELYDGRLIGFSGKQITITEALGKKYSYSELMG